VKANKLYIVYILNRTKNNYLKIQQNIHKIIINAHIFQFEM